jgi:hypothetical protein
MHVKLTRKTYLRDRTLGTLEVIDGDKVVLMLPCLELPWLENKSRISCIAPGTYEMVWEYSPAFKRKLWELKGVPGRSEVKIHGANYPSQLLGCIAPGLKFAHLDKDGALDVASSRLALEKFHEALKDHTKTTIEVTA